MSTRTIETVIAPQGAHFVGDGFRVHNFIPGIAPLSMQRMSPFLLLDYNAPYIFPPSDKIKGVGVHPHKGFETVTIAYKGRVAHHDSSGGGGVIDAGDVQWMTAASGILHKEYHEESFSKSGGEFQMVQLWVNLPAKDKKTNPKYQAITNADMTRVPLNNEGSYVEVIAGTYEGHDGPATTFTPVNLMNAHLKKGGKAHFSFPAHYNTAVLIIEGAVTVNGTAVVTDNFVLFKNNGEEFDVEAKEDAVVLVLSGQPIEEPIFAHGPFVMNTREEIIEAFDDYNKGKFGYLED
ncbi:pirin family protein [Sphingobacterium spiritivorum]|uniref:pirin family protein n=1 Tax=Sphingobacterium spiritivorum TaxID=258 RepID=UPI003DA31089